MTDGEYRVRIRTGSVWFESDETWSHGEATGIAVGAELKGADETEVIEDVELD